MSKIEIDLRTVEKVSKKGLKKLEELLKLAKKHGAKATFVVSDSGPTMVDRKLSDEIKAEIAEQLAEKTEPVAVAQEISTESQISEDERQQFESIAAKERVRQKMNRTQKLTNQTVVDLGEACAEKGISIWFTAILEKVFGN